MRHITDAMVDAVVTPAQAQAVLADAFVRFGHGEATMQARQRTEAQGVKLSTLGAVIPGQGVVGAKVYTTIAGQFNFVIVLFSSADGRPLATFEAGAITRLRTAACSVIAARALARPDSRTLALIGAGVQGQAHAEQFAQAFQLQEIRIHDPGMAESLPAALSARCGVPVRPCGAQQAVTGADIVITATRAAQPVVRGSWLAPGSFLAAVGSSLPGTRELDDDTLRRASVLAVEWRAQSLQEAGDLVLAAPGVLQDERIVELADLLTGRAPGRTHEREITVYKAVGVGLQDVALAGLAWRRLEQS
jgi:ornithine cyclodeaminase